jgi:hypothetical protein
LPELLKSKVIPVGVRAGMEGKYTFTLKPANSWEGMQVYLEDKLYSEKLIDLTKNPDYTVNLSAGASETRFVLHFVKYAVYPTPFKSNNDVYMENLVHIYAERNEVFVNYLSNKPAMVEIYDLLGREIISADLVCEILNRFKVNSERGYYIVRVFNNEFSRTEKVFLQ